MRLCYDQKYVNDNTYKKFYIPINDNECLVLIDGKYDVNGNLIPSMTILPETISEVVLERKRVKKMMKYADDPFTYNRLDAKQLGCKVFQNAVYGFLGVEKNALLACPVLMAAVCRIGQYMIKKIRYMMIKEHNGYVVYGDTDSVMVQFPYTKENPNSSDVVFSYYYKMCHNIAKLGTGLFKEPNVLEFETMKYPFWLRKKKNYAACEYSSETWKTDPKIAIKGLPFKKRDRCKMVRTIGHRVMELILNLDDVYRIKTFLTEQFDNLLHGKFDYEDLLITCLMKDESTYINTSLIQLQTAKKIANRRGTSFTVGSRISFVVLYGKEKLYMRGEDPSYAKKNNLKLDYMYYFEKQLMTAIEPLLLFHDIDISDIKKKFKDDMERKQHGMKTITDWFN